ncbi:unnamed protein product [Clonostachys rosea]|uniref:TLC domain-containing protein n=1 Tax=Bionectria ochroleuca TaxID=29856 RepID=A0ABY6UG94_BIOOC|nr:unnamed protein product [Clonostachys rosea]
MSNQSSTMDTAQHQLFLGAFIIGLGAYWVIFPLVEKLIKIAQPEWYEKNKSGELRYKILFPVMVMLIRSVNGTLVVLPACVMAARETKWELGQTMTTAGHVCVISQVVPWASELLVWYETSTELYLHHVFCTLLYFNTVAAPSLHMIKPLYVHTATQLGDIGLTVNKVMRSLGHRQQTSRVLYFNKIFQMTTVFAIKIPFMFYALGRIVLTPNGMWDLIRASCLLFLCGYSIRTQIVSFYYMRVAIQPPKGPIGLLFQRSGVFISRYNLALAASVAAAIVVKVLLYANSLNRPIGEHEHARVWIESITSVSALYLLISLSTMLWKRFLDGEQVLAEGYRSVKRGELFLRLGAFLTALMIHGRNTGNLMARTVGLSSQALSTAIVFTFLGWDLYVRLSIWMSVGEEARGLEQGDESSDAKDGKTNTPQKPSRAASDHAIAARQLRMVWIDVAIITAGLFLPNHFTTLEKSYTLFFTHALVQVLDEMMSQYNKGTIKDMMIGGSPFRNFASLKLALAVGQNVLAFCAVCGELRKEREQGILWASLAVALFSRISSYIVIPSSRRDAGAKSSARTRAPPGPPTLAKRLTRVLKTIFTSPEVYSVMVVTAIELFSLLELMKGRQDKPQTTVGFENLRAVMVTPISVASNLVATTLVMTSIVLPCK